MPPKKPGPVDKKKQQAAADATFGMKNKKGKKAQQIAKQTNAGRSREEEAKFQMALKRKAEKEEQKKIDAENALLFRKVDIIQKPQFVPPGVDPKSVLCVHFKAGNCQNGDTCKFSHDLTLDGKKHKADMFTDSRAVKVDEETLKTQDMSQWDDETLKLMLAKKNTGPSNASQKVCRQFLKAIEQKRWGWLWECPNGGARCPYKHALPPDYVFKDAKKENVVEKTLEEVLEEERAKLSGGVKVTPETYAVWYEKIKKKKEEELQKNSKSREKALKAGQVKMTGREWFSQEGYKEEAESEGDEVDILTLLKSKKKEEEETDAENARLAEELNKAVEEELAQTAKEKEEETLETTPAPKDGETTTEVPKETVTSEAPLETEPAPVTLANIDTSLFTENIEDIPDEFSDDE